MPQCCIESNSHSGNKTRTITACVEGKNLEDHYNDNIIVVLGLLSALDIGHSVGPSKSYCMHG